MSVAGCNRAAARLGGRREHGVARAAHGQQFEIRRGIPCQSANRSEHGSAGARIGGGPTDRGTFFHPCKPPPPLPRGALCGGAWPCFPSFFRSPPPVRRGASRPESGCRKGQGSTAARPRARHRRPVHAATASVPREDAAGWLWDTRVRKCRSHRGTPPPLRVARAGVARRARPPAAPRPTPDRASRGHAEAVPLVAQAQGPLFLDQLSASEEEPAMVSMSSDKVDRFGFLLDPSKPLPRDAPLERDGARALSRRRSRGESSSDRYDSDNMVTSSDDDEEAEDAPGPQSDGDRVEERRLQKWKSMLGPGTARALAAQA
eukprot:scaffold1505_cov390-Prasinococcus_capsulatus_cf.AAC.17